MFFFFKQKTAYEMRISDWSSDVCSSDLDFRFGGADANVIGGDRHVAGAEQAETAGHDVTVDARDDRQGAFLQTLEQVDVVVLGPRKVTGKCETLSALTPIVTGAHGIFPYAGHAARARLTVAGGRRSGW